jgi:AraC-like DNA-binding protein
MTHRDYPISHAAILIDVACEHGANRNQLMRLAKLDSGQLDNPHARVTSTPFRVLHSAAREMTGLPQLPLLFGSQLPLTSHGPLGYAIISCRSVRQALEILTKYYRLINDKALNIYEEDDQLHIEYAHSEDYLVDPITDTEVFYSALISATRNLLHKETLEAELHINYPAPAHAEYYEKVLKCDVVFDMPISKIIFPVSLLDAQPEYANPVMLKLFEQQCAEMLERMDSGEGFRHKVRKYLLTTKPNFPSLDQCADHFHMSPRTFRRRLSDEDITYQQVLDEIRRELAESYLRNPAISIYHCADLVGFKDISNFRRAFIRWTGLSPAAYKKKHQ